MKVHTSLGWCIQDLEGKYKVGEGALMVGNAVYFRVEKGAYMVEEGVFRFGNGAFKN